jgi:hypothetical protein
MDVKTSRKETRYQASGSVEVLMDNITDLYPVYSASDANKITNVEILDDSRLELLDRAMWAVLKQLGNDPLNPDDGNPIEECILGEVSAIVLITKIAANVLAVGPGVQIDYSTSIVDGKEYLAISLTLVPTT